MSESQRDPGGPCHAPTTCRAMRVQRAISLLSHEPRTSHSNTWCALVLNTTVTSHVHLSEHRSGVPASFPGSWHQQAWDGLEGLQSAGLRSRGQEAEPGGGVPGLVSASPTLESRDRVRRPAPNALTARWASRGPVGGEVSPPTPPFGSGEQRGRPEGFFNRAWLVI